MCSIEPDGHLSLQWFLTLACCSHAKYAKEIETFIRNFGLDGLEDHFVLNMSEPNNGIE